ncbi:hypothetical protein [Chryseobacterium lathyri]|uniref:Uncharacterized protein n=1 Tax=Chryseobacterium lathyri TaxID=395933 RepID=A0ABT9SR96_9FLAO|nr:hypothetical protein [Chryseobacterium lathyri]MDP9961969.1 hypothetical protein [Chryseobacterium lathyri]
MATLDAVVDYQAPEDQEAIQVVQLAAIGLQLKHGNKEANALIEQLKLGNINPGIGTKNIGKNVF